MKWLSLKMMHIMVLVYDNYPHLLWTYTHLLY